jgi:hypothetical protein
VKVRYRSAEAGTCLADLCSMIVCQAREPDPDGGIAVRALCADHARERDLELSIRNASGGTAEVLQFAEWERGPDGRVRRKGDSVVVE